MIRSISEILKMAHMAETKEAKIAVLRDNVSKALTTILISAYDDRVEWLLPPGLVPFKVMPEDSDQEGRLYQESKKLYMFLKDGGSDITQLRREMLFIQLLESLDKRDAFLMIAVKDKKLPYSTLTRELIDEAFPNMLYIEGRPVQEPTPDKPAPVEEPPVGEVKQVKKKGRPRKNPSVNTPKRPRGRPRKKEISKIVQDNQEIMNKLG